MKTVEAQPLDTGYSPGRDHAVAKIEHSQGRLHVVVQSLEGKDNVRVSFERIAGFRVLDEGSMFEYWPSCSWPNGWIFKVVQNGWLEQDSWRFVIHRTEMMSEYLITGQDECVSVITWRSPKVEKIAL